MRKPVIAANWKMYKTTNEAKNFVKQFKPLVEKNTEVEIVLCVPYTSLESLSEELKNEQIGLGAQNMYPINQGAFTGEISAEMLLNLGIKYVIIGHSERRQIFNETDEFIKQKLEKALVVGLTPILCIGETLEERESGATLTKCKTQIESAIQGVPKENLPKIIIAYEPIWAIGTGKTASPEDAEETIKGIRSIIAEIFDIEAAQKVRIQYGGSVNPENIKDLMSKDNIDGALVGGASLEATSFAQIVNYKG
ncbi:triosephosphate isomerase [Desulfonispora thiosulfatigenes DSM 11270]|uniref:Triosephosphate isomerase n=1 Tax=Desulfonispora thiosulfatigenes DSM 11270 TaxID=656914 RepID=A0A1W1UWD0_DESTI|nr:triose-phosphate isomerase [Desulfonispora thiosulfatigenes]SMB85397.1 triosephosphate isomerase [Desulfonispora thiosulfatigenes DSM 11270]